MLKEFIGTGKTIEEATMLAKSGLNAPLSADVKIEVIEMPKKKILGLFGGADAKVKASYDDGRKEKKAPKKTAPKQEKKSEPKKAPHRAAKKEMPAPKKDAAAVSEKKNSQSEFKKEKREYPENVNLEYAKEYLAQIIKGLNIDDAKINATYEKGVINMDLDCSDFGIVIGRRGETLDSIQYLLSLVMKKSANGYVRVVINVGNYREKRKETLRHLASKNAAYVIRTGRRYTFEPMNPYERRVIHTAIQEIDGVESRSVGYDQERRVVIEPTGGVRMRSDYRRSAPRTASYVRPENNRAPKADRADLPKFGKIEINKD